jgi:site-specific DNA recombinase
MARILRNPFYYGEYDWKGKRYKGTHKPLINEELFDKVQLVMGFFQKPRMTKHDFSFSGTLTCGHCGCSIVAEEKRKKSGKTYIYYHCTNGKGSCEDVTYLRQEAIEAVFIKALEDISLTPEVIEKTRNDLLKTSHQEREFQDTQIKALTERYRKIQSYISNSRSR